jgi:hypothetical protein
MRRALGFIGHLDDVPVPANHVMGEVRIRLQVVCDRVLERIGPKAHRFIDDACACCVDNETVNGRGASGRRVEHQSALPPSTGGSGPPSDFDDSLHALTTENNTTTMIK